MAYTLLGEQATISAVSTFTFASIPQTHQTLELWFRGHQYFTSGSGGGDVYCETQLQGSTSGGAYRVNDGKARLQTYARGGTYTSAQFASSGITEGPYIPIGGANAQGGTAAWKTNVMFRMRFFNYAQISSSTPTQWENVACDSVNGDGNYSRTGWDYNSNSRKDNVTGIRMQCPYAGSAGVWKGQATLYGIS